LDKETNKGKNKFIDGDNKRPAYFDLREKKTTTTTTTTKQI